MAEEKENRDITRECFVAFLDVMGTKDRIGREGHEKALKKQKSLLFTKKAAEILPKMPKVKMASIKPIVFSDSIILVSEDIQDNTLKDLLSLINFILHYTFIISMPIKGAIAR